MSDTMHTADSPSGRLLNRRLKLRHLELLSVLSERGSLSSAASYLHVAQPALTRSLREVEEIVGAQLFERGARGMTPTEIGQTLVKHAQGVLGQLNIASRDIDDLLHARSGTVSVGTHLAASSHLLPNAILAVRKQAPDITIVVREGTPKDLRAELLAGEVDVVVGRIQPSEPDDRLVTEALYQEPILIVAAVDHEATTLEAPTLTTLREYPWVLPVHGTYLRTQLDELFAAEGLELPARRVDCTLLPVTRELIVRGASIGVLPRLLIENDPDIVAVGRTPSTLRLPVGLSTVTNRTPSPAVHRFLSALRQSGAQLRQRFDEPNRHGS